MHDSLDRFRRAHRDDYQTALAEIRAGRKQSHWMWYIFPQLRGLGHSYMARHYEIRDRAEALDYWNDPVLREHLLEISAAVLECTGSIGWIMGYPDDMKLRSCMTLFWLVSGEAVFKAVLDKFYDGALDAFTVDHL